MGYQVIYVADDGTTTPVPSTYEKGFLKFSTGHFSEYAIVKDPSAPPVQSPGTESGGLLWLIPVTGAIIVSAVVAYFVRKRQRKWN